MQKKTNKSGAGRPKRYPTGTEIVTITRNVIRQHISLVDEFINELKADLIREAKEADKQAVILAIVLLILSNQFQ